ncbi:MAG TPA: Yip1 family protein [Methylophilaceae bacterium]|nr:Yip1 family protein [Methylophilaceae bacterium]
MNIVQSWRGILKSGNSKSSGASQAVKPEVSQTLFWYVIPLALITPIMLSLVIRQYPDVFQDRLPGDRLYIVSLAVFFMQVVSVPLMAWTVKNLAEMVDIKPDFRDAFLVTAIAATPVMVVSLGYVVPSFTFNLVMHGIAAVAAAALIYLGLKNVFDLQRRGARIMLTLTVVATASLGFGIVLIATLMFWGQVQEFQFAAH